MSLTCGLHDAFKYHHDLKLLRLHGPLREVVEGAFGVDHVADGQRRDEKELIRPGAEPHVQLQLIQRKELAFRRLARLKESMESETHGEKKSEADLCATWRQPKS